MFKCPHMIPSELQCWDLVSLPVVALPLAF